MKLTDATGNKPSALRLIQLTDCHLGADSGYEQSGINTYDSLNAVMASIAQSGVEVEQLVVTGDVSCNGLDASYQLFSRIVGEQRAYCWLPGNHDDLQTMNNNLKKPFEKKVSVGGWNLFMINSARFDRAEGGIADSELTEVAAHLQAQPNVPTLLFMHHPPVKVGCKWLDRQKISNARQLFDLLGSFNNVRALFCGHVHQEQQVGQLLPIYSTPSTCFQFQANSDEFAISIQPPGYRWIDIYSNGTFQTGTSYLSNYTQVPDQRCQGY